MPTSAGLATSPCRVDDALCISENVFLQSKAEEEEESLKIKKRKKYTDPQLTDRDRTSRKGEKKKKKVNKLKKLTRIVITRADWLARSFPQRESHETLYYPPPKKGSTFSS